MNTSSIFDRIGYLLIFLLITVSTLVYGAVHQSVLTVVYILIALMLILWAVDCMRSGVIRFNSSLLQLPLVGAAVYGFVQVIPFGTLNEAAGVSGIPRTISIEPFATEISAIHFIALLIFFAAALTRIDSANRLRKLTIFLSVFGFGYAFFAILQSVLSPDKIFGIYGRPGANPFGSFVNRNHFAAWIELAIALPLGLLFTGAVSKDKRLLYITAISLMGVALIVSGSRGGLVAFLVEIIFLLLITNRSEGKGKSFVKPVLAVGLVLVVIAGSFFVGGESSLTRISTDQAEAAGTNADRAHIWSVTLKVIGDSMPFGVGLGAFGTAYGKFDVNSGLERVEQAHNDFLQVISDAGIVGAFLGIGFLFLLFRAGKRSLQTNNDHRRGLAAGALAGIVAVLVHSFFDFALHTTAVALLFLTVLSVLIVSGTTFPDDVPNEDEPRHRPKPSRRTARS